MPVVMMQIFAKGKPGFFGIARGRLRGALQPSETRTASEIQRPGALRLVSASAIIFSRRSEAVFPVCVWWRSYCFPRPDRNSFRLRSVRSFRGPITVHQPRRQIRREAYRAKLLPVRHSQE